MRYVLAMVPILAVLVLMIWRRWGAHQAGVAAWLAGLGIGVAWFGATPDLFWVSQAKGVLLSLFVLWVMWPALFLYHWIDCHGGIQDVAAMLEEAIASRGMCLVLLAWALSGLLEGLAGFGLPIAVVAPMLVALRVPPLQAVAAVAVGHSWAVTFGDMGVILQTLSAVVSIPVRELVPWAGLLMGAACLLCGVGAAVLLGEAAHWPKIVALSIAMGLAQFGLAEAGLIPLSASGAGLAGMLIYVLCAALWRKFTRAVPGPAVASDGVASHGVEGGGTLAVTPAEVSLATARKARSSAWLAIGCYGGLTLLMAAVTMLPQLRVRAQSAAWKPTFPQVASSQGFVTAAGPGQVFRPLVHPGTLTLAVALVSIALAGRRGFPRALDAARATVRSAGLASIGILFMVGLSVLMDHCGMSFLLAQGLSACLGAAYPVVAPTVGILGAFATGSNNNSNVLFGSLQKNVALLLNIPAPLLAAAQTAGGSLGSMLAPAKIVVGCSTVGQLGQEGQVLRRTVPWGLGIGLALGLLTLVLAWVR